jgi:hypothetical protein
MILGLEPMIHIQELLTIAIYQGGPILQLFAQIEKIFCFVEITTPVQCNTHFKQI